LVAGTSTFCLSAPRVRPNTRIFVAFQNHFPHRNPMSTATTTSTDIGQHTPTRGRQPEAQQPVTQQAGVVARCAARSGRPERGPRGRHCRRQDRGVTPVGLGSVPLGGSGGSVFAAGSWQWRKGQADGAGAGGELIDRRQLDSRTGTITTTCRSCFNYRPEDQRLRLRRRNAPHPAQARPLATSASVIGSGTATTPKSLLWLITAQTVLEVMSTP